MEVALIGPSGRTVLGATKVTIGRAPDNTLVLTDPKVVAHHAELRPEGPYYSLVDLSNGYGTFVNEQLVSSGMPRVLQPGDMIRIGDTPFTFTMQQAASGEYPPMAAAPPNQFPPSQPNYMANTAYGMGNYPVPPPPPDQPSLYPFPYNTQMPTYITPPYTAPPQQPAYIPNYNGPQPPVPQKPRVSLMMIISVAIAVLIIIAGSVGFLVYHTNQVAQDTIHATATAQTLASNHATATVTTQQNATATVLTSTNATATAAVTSPYAPFTTLALNNPLTDTGFGWNEGTACLTSATGYQVSDATAHTIQYCTNTTEQYSAMAYQVMMTIHTGDCGGLIFRYSDVNNLYIFEVCQNGTYAVDSHIKDQWTLLPLNADTNSAIKKGLDVQNRLGVTLQGNTIVIYVNGSRIDTVTDPNLKNTPFTQGHIGLFADNRTGPTSIIYTNALVWTT